MWRESHDGEIAFQAARVGKVGALKKKQAWRDGDYYKNPSDTLGAG